MERVCEWERSEGNKSMTARIYTPRIIYMIKDYAIEIMIDFSHETANTITGNIILKANHGGDVLAEVTFSKREWKLRG